MEKTTSTYTSCTSGIIQRGEALFPMLIQQKPRDYEKINKILSIIPFECDRYLTMEEILNFYD